MPPITFDNITIQNGITFECEIEKPSIITTDLQFYIDANNPASWPGSGTTWFDLSGNNNDFTWDSTPSTTTSGGITWFNILGYKCDGPASNSLGITSATGYTVTVIAYVLTNAVNVGFQFYQAGGDPTWRGIFTHLPFSDNTIYFDQGGTTLGSGRTTAGFGANFNSWQIFTFRRFPTSPRNIFRNKTIIGTNNTTSANINFDSRAVTLGYNLSQASSTWNARVGGFFAYNRPLSDAEISANVDAIKATYGITA
jgi:hypothetical protein